MGSTGEGNGKPLQHSCLENLKNSMNFPVRYVHNMLLKKSREIAPERVKRLSQSGNDDQLWMYLVVKVKSDTVKNNFTYKPGMLGP